MARATRRDLGRRLVKSGQGWLVTVDSRDKRRESDEDEVKKRVKK